MQNVWKKENVRCMDDWLFQYVSENKHEMLFFEQPILIGTSIDITRKL